MCYDLTYLTKRQIDYAKRYGRAEDVEDIARRHPPVYHTSGFDHPNIPVITSENPTRVQLMEWGLIPWWIKTNMEAVKISNSTLNARAETILTKPAYRDSIDNQRCLIVADGFFEHHHYESKTYPYFIFQKSGEPFSIAGLYSVWKSPDGIEKKTVALITTVGNKLLSSIHNNPKMEGPRMPVILPKELENEWLQPVTSTIDRKRLLDYLIPFDSNALDAFTVSKLRGKNSLGNIKEAQERKVYQELNKPLSLF